MTGKTYEFNCKKCGRVIELVRASAPICREPMLCVDCRKALLDTGDMVAKLDYLVDAAASQRDVNKRICATLDRIEAKLDKLDEML